MENLVLATVFILAATWMIWLGVRQRQRASANYEEDRRRYTATAAMTVTHLNESEIERWEDRDDGTRELLRETVYTPTYEYTVNGTVYQYHSRQGLSGGKGVGSLVTGYYDPSHPDNITENKPCKPVLSGCIFFAGAVILLFFAGKIILNMLFWML